MGSVRRLRFVSRPFKKGKMAKMEIAADELAELLQGCYSEYISGLAILDIRSRRAFRKGSIVGSVNIQAPRELDGFVSPCTDLPQVFVFCGDRSPRKSMSFAAQFRDSLLERGAEGRVFYLEGGLGGFFAEYPEHCTGQYADDEAGTRLCGEKGLTSQFTSPPRTPRKSRALSEVVERTPRRSPLGRVSPLAFHSPRIQ